MAEKAGNGDENNGPEEDTPEFGRGVHGRQLVLIEQHDAPPSPGPAHPETGRLALDRDPAFRQFFFGAYHFCFPRLNRLLTISWRRPRRHRAERPGAALIH